MYKIITLIFIAWNGLTYGQIIDIPDPKFKNALVNTKCVDLLGDGIGDRDADINNDGQIDVNEALNSPMLLLQNLNIKSLEGLSNFKNLTRLNCSNNQLEILELKELKYLYILNCENNMIKQITNIEVCENLVGLYFEKNNVDSLNLFSNHKLMNITCELNNLSHLILGRPDSLEYLRCYENKIQYLNLINAHKLENLYCYDNELETLDVSSSGKLKDIRCYNNKISYLNLKNNFLEETILISNNPFEIICCDENEINSLKNMVNNNVFVYHYCSFTPGGKYYTLSGNSKFDKDNNGCNNSDGIVPNLKLNITSPNTSGNIVSNATGIYNLSLLEGSHIIKPIIEYPDFYNVSPTSTTVSFPNASDTIIQNFCITPKGILRQTELTIIPTTVARPGFDATYKVVLSNKGNQVENGILNFSFDGPRMDFVSSDITPSTQADNYISWEFKDLLPFETRCYFVTLNVNSPSETPAVNAGDVLQLSCSVLDNVITLNQEVVGSYDPNDKTCLEGKTITPEQVGKYVHYLIRFENTGNYAAENIVVKDVIDESTFDISTLQITDASHQAWARINGNIVEFIFEKIQLPFDAATNDGYIAFKIKTKSTLILGNELKNEANIYFDYNLPILTNKTSTTIALPVVNTNETLKDNVEVFPNPVHDILHFSSKEKINKVEVFDINGRLVQVSNVVNGSVNVERLGSGAYLVKITSQHNQIHTKMIKIWYT